MYCVLIVKPHQASPAEIKRLDLPQDALIYQAKGCDQCNYTGYRGRTAIYELIVIDDALKELIHKKEGEQVMLQHVRNRHDSLLPIAVSAYCQVRQA